MSIYDKIEQIRQKPEHIRMRYVWACVTVCMVLVLGIWVISLKGRQYQVAPAGEVAGQASIFDELQKQKESLGQYKQEVGDITGTLQQGLQDVQNVQSIPSQEGFSGGNVQDTTPLSNPASLLQ